jgi:hypothetical protein
MRKDVLRRSFYTFFVAFGVALAQQPTAEIRGVITDVSGGTVPGASVELVNTATARHWETLSNETGNYAFSILPPGAYRITVKKQGFESAVRSGIELTVSQVARLDFKLNLGTTTQVVEVTGAAPLLESDTASTGQLIATKPINDLPLNGRNFLQLAKLSMGVTDPKPGDRAVSGGSFIANGVRAQLNNFLLDGVDNNAKIVDQQNSSPVVIQPSVDALQEFRVETNNYSAEYGYSAGAVVNAMIKSGTNSVHGDVFEFLRNSALDARNFFATVGTAKPVLQQNQFGGVIGGPIVKNRAFVFGSWEGTRVNRGNTYVETVPTAAMRDGDFSGLAPIFDPETSVPSGKTYVRTQFPNNQIPTGRMDPAALKLLAAEPLPTFPNQTVNNYVSSPTNTNRANRFDVKEDTQLSQNDSLFARYSYFGGNAVTYGPFPEPLVGSTNFQIAPKDNLGNGAAVGETHIFKPTLVNEFRAGYNRIQDFLSPFVKDNIASEFGLSGIPTQPGVTGLPNISISGFANLGEASFLPNDKISETITAEDHASWTLGKHLLKFGGDFRWVRSWFYISSNARGAYTFNGAFTQNPQKTAGTGSGMADFLLGIPNSSSLSNLISGDLRYNYWGGYLQDDWKVTPRLTVNLGLRYELWTQPVERNDRQANYLTNEGALIFANSQVPAGVPAALVKPVPGDLGTRSLMKTDTNNFAPRLGIAFQAASHTVIRAGAGIFFADDPAIGASARLVANPPFYQATTYATDQINPLVYLSTGFPENAIGSAVDISAASLSTWAPDMKQAYVYHWSFGVQQQVHNTIFEANYVGTKGNDLAVTYNINTPYAGPGSVASRRPFQGLGNINYTSGMDTSSYNALEARVEHRYAHGLSVLASYTFSKTLDVGGESLIGDLSLRDARNVKAERSLSSADMRHRFVASALYELPFGRGRMVNIDNAFLNAVLGGWQLNGILTLRSGTPFTPSLGTSTANTGAARPDRIADGNLASDQRSIDYWFDKAAFVAPTPYNFGNAGRNILIGPGAANLDSSLFKNFRLGWLGESGELQFRAEAFNTLNHPQFGLPNTRVDIKNGGTITSLSNEMREIQFGVKILF